MNEGIKNPNYRHGASATRIYGVWAGMMARCRDKSHKSYPDYGGRGITVCWQWHSATRFVEWALSNGYRRGLLLDRKKHDEGYSPDNCRWLTAKESARHKRKTKLDAEMVRVIRAMIATGDYTMAEIGRRFNVTDVMICAIKNGKAWV